MNVSLRRESLRRSRTEIFRDVLQAIHDGEYKPTKIMYKTNMSWKTLQEYLDIGVENGLLVCESTTTDKRTRRRYGITMKGIDLLRGMLKTERLMPWLK